MKRFMLLHYGFKPPTPEIMSAWKAWFEHTTDAAEQHGGFHGAAREITHDGATDLPMDGGAITGYSIIRAESLDQAEEIARANPFITSIRVYEIT